MSPLHAAWQMMKGWNKWYHDMMKAREQASTTPVQPLSGTGYRGSGAVHRRHRSGGSTHRVQGINIIIISSSSSNGAYDRWPWQMRAVSGALRRMMNRKLSMAWEQWQQVTPLSLHTPSQYASHDHPQCMRKGVRCMAGAEGLHRRGDAQVDPSPGPPRCPHHPLYWSSLLHPPHSSLRYGACLLAYRCLVRTMHGGSGLLRCVANFTPYRSLCTCLPSPLCMPAITVVA